jgi:hypothetical protein
MQNEKPTNGVTHLRSGKRFEPGAAGIQNSKNFRAIQRIVGMAAVASIVFFVGYAYTTSTHGVLAAAFLLFLGAVALSPVALWWWLSRRLMTSGGRYALLAAALLIFTAGAFIYYDGLFVHLDALNVLGFLFLPPWQLGALGIVFGVSHLVERRRHA